MNKGKNKFERETLKSSAKLEISKHFKFKCSLFLPSSGCNFGSKMKSQRRKYIHELTPQELQPHQTVYLASYFHPAINCNRHVVISRGIHSASPLVGPVGSATQDRKQAAT